MTTIKILIEGYAREQNQGYIASSTVCLILSEGKKIITDPGCNREKLLFALEKENITPYDIDYVFLSHCHLDHILLAGIFGKAKVVSYDSNLMYNNDLMTEYNKHVLGNDIEIIATPGHTPEHLSLLVNTERGKIAVAGDVIWWLDDEKQLFNLYQKDRMDLDQINMDDLVKSRKKLLEISDYIIPGHGNIFKVN